MSEKPDDESKIRLDNGIWPEGPHCRPLALHSRVANHRRLSTDRRATFQKSSLELYDGFWLYLDEAEFARWMDRAFSQQETSAGEGSSHPTVRNRQPLSPSEAEEIYKKYVAEYPADRKTPSRDDDQAYMQQFGSVGRTRVRELRRKYAPATWTERGTPKKYRPLT